MHELTGGALCLGWSEAGDHKGRLGHHVPSVEHPQQLLRCGTLWGNECSMTLETSRGQNIFKRRVCVALTSRRNRRKGWGGVTGSGVKRWRGLGNSPVCTCVRLLIAALKSNGDERPPHLYFTILCLKENVRFYLLIQGDKIHIHIGQRPLSYLFPLMWEFQRAKTFKTESGNSL